MPSGHVQKSHFASYWLLGGNVEEIGMCFILEIAGFVTLVRNTVFYTFCHHLSLITEI